MKPKIEYTRGVKIKHGSGPPVRAGRVMSAKSAQAKGRQRRGGHQLRSRWWSHSGVLFFQGTRRAPVLSRVLY